MALKELTQFETERKELRTILNAAKDDPTQFDAAFTLLDLLGDQIKYAKKKVIKDETVWIHYECSACDAVCKKDLKFEMVDPAYCEETGESGEAKFEQSGVNSKS